jgi:hypothetical protein
MSAHEITMAFQFLVSTLKNDATLANELAPGGVHRGMAPPQTATPFVIVAFQSGADTLTGNAVRLISRTTFQAKAVGPASVTTTIAQAADRIDTLLKLVRNASTTGGVILDCYRASPLQLDELVNGELWTNWGGLYNLEIWQS